VENMARKKFEAAQIIGHLRGIEIFLGKGKTAAEACRELLLNGEIFYTLIEAQTLIEN